MTEVKDIKINVRLTQSQHSFLVQYGGDTGASGAIREAIDFFINSKIQAGQVTGAVQDAAKRQLELIIIEEIGIWTQARWHIDRSVMAQFVRRIQSKLKGFTDEEIETTTYTILAKGDIPTYDPHDPAHRVHRDIWQTM